MTAPEPQATIRKATTADVPALIDLRSLMLQAMGSATGGGEWRPAAYAWFEGRLADPASFCCYVADVRGSGVVSSVAASIESRAPSPDNISGRIGNVFNVSTLGAHRRRGLAGRCFDATMSWLCDVQNVRVVMLAATTEGLPLYARHGFHESQFPQLRFVSPLRSH